MTGLQASYAVVIPTVGRSTLADTLTSLATATRERPPARVVLVDDRPRPEPLPQVARLPRPLADRLVLCGSAGGGPAAARNVGWRATDPCTEWVVFLDDDVVVSPRWGEDLVGDLAQPEEVAGVQGRVEVPLPPGRRPTDWERGTAGLATAAWITADMAYRRRVLEVVGGFDERFPRAYREDADIALRVARHGWLLRRGRRRTTHPVRAVDRWVSLRTQAGNADDPLMRRLHGPNWRAAAGAPPGRRGRHLAVTAAAVAALAGATTGRRVTAAVGAAVWIAGTAELALARVAPGPRDRDEVATMLATSVVIPPLACWHWLRGWWRHRSAVPWQARSDAAPTVRAVLFDRDGTLVHDVPYNGDPAAVQPVDGAVDVIANLRRSGVRTGVVTNQSGVGRGLLTDEQVRQVNARVDDIFGGFDVWAVCLHRPEDGCGCRKPAPGLVLDAAERLNLRPDEVAVVGDIGSDVAAARAAGAQAVLVPTPQTRADEVAAAPLVAADLASAVRLVLGAPS